MAAAASGGREKGVLPAIKVESVGDFETSLEDALKATDAGSGAFVEVILARRG